MSLVDIALSIVALFPAIIFHEVAHGYVAFRLGDPTAKAKGRLTFNPIEHVDLMGTIIVPLLLVVMRSPFLFGWAKPVPVNPQYFLNPFKGMLYVAIAGPATNIALALATTVVGRIAIRAVPDSFFFADRYTLPANITQVIFFLLGMFVIFNIILAFFNMIPVPPLDGSRVLAYFLPPAGRRAMITLERYGFFILLAIILLGGLQPLFGLIDGIPQALLGIRWLFLAFH
ncbi:site-2 protease family protein [Candidatus Bipolaricaulota bacterium]|nr:site-2 protease family protein [Candidatus Bipolaricaulota bacterium]